MHRKYFESKYAQQDYSLRPTTGTSTCQISFRFLRVMKSKRMKALIILVILKVVLSMVYSQ